MAVKFISNGIDATDNAVGYNVSVGTFSSTASVAENKLNSAKTKSVGVYADCAGAALSATAYRAIQGRLLINYAQSGDCSMYGLQGHLKNTAVDTSSGNKAGVWGYYEAISGATVAANSAGVYAMIDVPSGATIGGTIGGLQVSSNDLGGTHTAKAACIHCPNPVAGTWDYGIVFGDTTGATTANTHTIDSHALAYVIKVRVGAVDGFVPVFAAVPA